MDRMSPLDAAFIEAEDSDPRVSMAIASVTILEGPPPPQKEIVERIRTRLDTVPRYRQKVRTIPLNLNRPIWVDDPHFDISYHIRRTALASPGDDETLSRTVGRLMSQRLDRDRPLWEYWVIEGLSGGRWALLAKVHHCMVDGVGGMSLYALVIDAFDGGERAALPASPLGAPPGPPARRTGRPSTLAVLASAVADLARDPTQQVKALVTALSSPVRLLDATGQTLRGVAAIADVVLPTTASSLSGPISQHRRYGMARTSLAEITLVRRALGGTVNDVVLTVLTGAYRHLLLCRGEEPGPRSVRTLVPVSLRRPDAESVLENEISMLLPFLPVHLSDPVERLRCVREALTRRRASGETEAGVVMTTLAKDTVFAPISWGLRLAAKLPQRNVTTVTTNVPGPPMRLHMLGRPILEIFPWVPIASTVRFGVAVLSYHGQVRFGVSADYDSAADVHLLAHAIEHGMRELVEAATARTATTAPAAKRTPKRATDRTTKKGTGKTPKKAAGTTTGKITDRTTEKSPRKVTKNAPARQDPGGRTRSA